jgi:predicted RNA binding protein YcfA (HicA-like mRNA interferase family)
VQIIARRIWFEFCDGVQFANGFEPGFRGNSTAKIVRRLKSDGWTFDRHGSNHDIYRHASIPGIIEVPRHIKVSPGVWRSIARKAGWPN